MKKLTALLAFAVMASSFVLGSCASKKQVITPPPMQHEVVHTK